MLCMRCWQNSWGAAHIVWVNSVRSKLGAAHEDDSCRASSSSAVAAAASGLTLGLSGLDRRRTDGVSDGCTARSGSGSGCICSDTTRPLVLVGIMGGSTAAAERTSTPMSGCVSPLGISSGTNADSAVLTGATSAKTPSHGQLLMGTLSVTLVAMFVTWSSTPGCGSRRQRAATIGLSAVLHAKCKAVQRAQLSASAQLSHAHMSQHEHTGGAAGGFALLVCAAAV